MPAPPIIEVDHVTKEFRLGTERSLRRTLLDGVRRLGGKPVEERPPFKALDDVHFSIEPGEVVGIIGHNGAGKSTLLKLLANIAAPTRGNVAVRGRVAPLIEVGAGLVPDMTGRENVYLNATILGMKKAEIARKFDDIVAFAELEEFIDTPVKRYSSGMQVRLGFAIATSVEAEILIVDEVLAVGDLAFQRKCVDRMERIIERDGRTLIVVGHNIRQLERLCSRVLFFDHGRISMDGEAAQVCAAFNAQMQQKVQAQQHAASTGIVPATDCGYLKVNAVEIIDVGRHCATDAVPMHQPAQIDVHFDALRDMTGIEVVVGFHTVDFVYVSSTSNLMTGPHAQFEEGSHVLSCRFSDIPMRPGNYCVRLAFLDRLRHMLWYGENLAPFRVEPGRVDITRMPEVGVVDIPVDWAQRNVRPNSDSRSMSALG